MSTTDGKDTRPSANDGKDKGPDLNALTRSAAKYKAAYHQDYEGYQWSPVTIETFGMDAVFTSRRPSTDIFTALFSAIMGELTQPDDYDIIREYDADGTRAGIKRLRDQVFVAAGPRTREAVPGDGVPPAMRALVGQLRTGNLGKPDHPMSLIKKPLSPPNS